MNIRSTLIDGEPWFVGADVLRTLYGTPSGKGSAYLKLGPTEVTKVDRINFEGRGGHPLVLVSESGLYKLILRSDKAEALAFQDWITSEVLPSIRKTGKYALADHGREAMPLPMDIAEAVASALGQLAETGGLQGRPAELLGVGLIKLPPLEPRSFWSPSGAKRCHRTARGHRDTTQFLR